MIAMIGMNSNISNGSKLIKSGEFRITNPNTEDMCKLFNDFLCFQIYLKVILQSGIARIKFTGDIFGFYEFSKIH